MRAVWHEVPTPLVRPVRAVSLAAAALALLASACTAEWLTDGLSPHRILPLQVLAAAGIVGGLFRRTHRTVSATIGGVAGGVAVALIVAGPDSFAPGGAGLGPRVPLVTVAFILLAIGGLPALVPTVDRPRSRSATLWSAVAGVVATGLAAVLAWAGAVTYPAHVNDRHTDFAFTRPEFTTTFDGAKFTTGRPVSWAASSVHGSVVVRSEPRRAGQPLDVPNRTVVEGVRDPILPSSTEIPTWEFSRAGARLLSEPVVGDGVVYLRYATWGPFGTTNTSRIDGAGLRIVVLDLRTGHKVREFSPPTRESRVIGASASSIVFADWASTNKSGYLPTRMIVTDQNGNRRWTAQPPDDSGTCQMANASILDGESVLVSQLCDGRPLAVQKRTLADGAVTWQHEVTDTSSQRWPHEACAANAVYSSPATIVISTCALAGDTPVTSLIGLSGGDGSETWRTSLGAYHLGLDSRYPFSFHRASYGVTYRPGTGVLAADPDGLSVIDPVDGKLISRHPLELPRHLTYPAPAPTPYGLLISQAPWDTVGPSPVETVWVG